MSERLRERQVRSTNARIIPGLEDLWSETLGHPSVCVAVLDGPVDLLHPAFENATLTLTGERTSNNVDALASQHGTAVASIIFGQHRGPVKGIAPSCRGLIIPIFSDEHAAIRPCLQIDLARAILKALEMGARIVNISGGEFANSNHINEFLEQALRECVKKDVLVVAAAGNEGCKCLHVPGLAEAVLAVGAMDRQGNPLPFSNWGYGAKGILASGDNLVGASVGGGVRACTGTSFATAVVSGVAALLMSLLQEAGRELSGSLVRMVLKSTAKNCSHQKIDNCDRLLAGRLDISAASTYIKTFIAQRVSNVSARTIVKPSVLPFLSARPVE